MKLEEFLSRLHGVKKTADGYTARCPVTEAHTHGDKKPSLTVAAGSEGILVKCHAGEGCPTEDICRALGITVADLFYEPKARDEPRIVATYDYTDEWGAFLFQAVRFDPKRFLQRRKDKMGNWIWKLGDTRRVLYHLPNVVAAVARGEPVFVVEGEKDVHAVEKHGATATTNPMGAGKWRPEYAESLKGATVYVVADRDEKGYAHARQVAASVARSATQVIICEPVAGKDVSDHLAAGRSLDELAVIDDGQPEPSDSESESDSELDGPGLLDELATILARYVAFPSETARDAVALWAAHCHCVHAFESTPRLAVLSPEKGSGKTRTLEVLEGLVPAPMFVANCTAAALFRTVAAQQATVLFDESDTYFGPRVAKDHEELRGLVNAGHRRGAVAYRCVGQQQEVRVFPAYAAVALAGIGDLPDTILDRAVVVQMRRRAPTEKVTPFRRRHAAPVLAELRDRLNAWCKTHADELGAAEPKMPDGFVDRPADVWEPLLAIADLAGGDWPERARTAAVELNAARRAADPSLGVRLLDDIRSLFCPADEKGEPLDEVEAMHTEVLLEKLVKLDESPWGDLWGKPLNARGLASRLRRFGIRPTSIRLPSTAPTKKGYQAADMRDAWARYLQPLTYSPGEAEQAEQAEQPQVTSLFSVPDIDLRSGCHPEHAGHPEQSAPPPTSTCSVVPDVPDSWEREEQGDRFANLDEDLW